MDARRGLQLGNGRVRVEPSRGLQGDDGLFVDLQRPCAVEAVEMDEHKHQRRGEKQHRPHHQAEVAEIIL